MCILNATIGSLYAESDVPISAKLLQVNKIWGEKPHNAFTDLIRWHDRWYCAFREAQNHVGTQGQLRIITSADGEHWESAAALTDPTYDLRDANLSIMPDGRLMAIGGAQLADGTKRKTGTFASYSKDGTEWTTPAIILPVGRWMWGATWHDGTAWGVSYGAPERHGINSLMTSKDGENLSRISRIFSLRRIGQLKREFDSRKMGRPFACSDWMAAQICISRLSRAAISRLEVVVFAEIHRRPEFAAVALRRLGLPPAVWLKTASRARIDVSGREKRHGDAHPRLALGR